MTRIAWCLVAAMVPLPAFSADISRDLAVTGVWSRATAIASVPGAIYATISDHGAPDRLVGVTTPRGRAQLHSMTMNGDVMEMRPVADIAVASGATVVLGPDGDHVMLTGLAAPLHAGESFPVTFRFAHARPITAVAHVGAAGARGP